MDTELFEEHPLPWRTEPGEPWAETDDNETPYWRIVDADGNIVAGLMTEAAAHYIATAVEAASRRRKT